MDNNTIVFCAFPIYVQNQKYPIGSILGCQKVWMQHCRTSTMPDNATSYLICQVLFIYSILPFCWYKPVPTQAKRCTHCTVSSSIKSYKLLTPNVCVVFFYRTFRIGVKYIFGNEKLTNNLKTNYKFDLTKNLKRQGNLIHSDLFSKLMRKSKFCQEIFFDGILI